MLCPNPLGLIVFYILGLKNILLVYSKIEERGLPWFFFFDSLGYERVWLKVTNNFEQPPNDRYSLLELLYERQLTASVYEQMDENPLNHKIFLLGGELSQDAFNAQINIILSAELH